jgi:hypothetical protein
MVLQTAIASERSAPEIDQTMKTFSHGVTWDPQVMRSIRQIYSPLLQCARVDGVTGTVPLRGAAPAAAANFPAYLHSSARLAPCRSPQCYICSPGPNVPSWSTRSGAAGGHIRGARAAVAAANTAGQHAAHHPGRGDRGAAAAPGGRGSRRAPAPCSAERGGAARQRPQAAAVRGALR